MLAIDEYIDRVQMWARPSVKRNLIHDLPTYGNVSGGSDESKDMV